MAESVRLPQALRELKLDTNIIGSPVSGQILQWDSSQNKWHAATITTSNSVDVLTTKGDTLYYNTGYSRLPIGPSGYFSRSDGLLPSWQLLKESDVSGLTTDLSGKVNTNRSIITTFPIIGGGDLSSNRTISISLADSTHSGYLSAQDWNKFNNQASGTVYWANLTAPSFLSVSGNPITTSGTFAITLANQAQNTFFAAPSGIGGGTPTFRSILASDIPNISESQVTNLTTDLNSKVSNTRQILTSSPLTGGGDLSADRTLSMTVSSSTTSGYLTSIDWQTFNNKLSTSRNINTSAPLSGGGDLSVDRTISMSQGSSSTSGYIIPTDWSIFNSKVGPTRTISTNYPLQGGGDLSANRILTIDQATSSTSGYLSSTDWQSFNSKLSSTRQINTTFPLTGGGDLTADRTFSMPAASVISSGYLTQADWNSFNSKLSSTRAINTTAPLTGGGDLSTDRTLSMPVSSVTSSGYLTSIDWQNFNYINLYTQQHFGGL